MEAKHDEYGPIWPVAVAPWQVHLCVLKSKTRDMNTIGFELYDKLKEKYDVIMDDRNVGPGAQFADADLLGVPVRVVIGEKNLKEGNVEIVTRDKSIKKLVPLVDAAQAVQEVLEELKNRA
jgi:prolyl-tRNA synthetase